MHRTLYIVLFLACVGIVQAGPVGCDWHNSTILKCWNNGTIENTTYIRTDGQFVNGLDRFSWATNELGAFYIYNGMRYMYYLDFSMSDLKYESDNETYYRAWFEYERRILYTKIYMNYSFYQDLNDNYVNITFDFDSNPRFGLRFYILRGFKDINIENDNDDNIVNYVWGGEQYSRNLSIDMNVTDYPVSDQMSIGDLDSSRGIFAKLNHNYTLDSNINHVELYREVQLPIHESFDWIDIDICTITIPRFCLYQWTRLFPDSSYVDNSTIQNKYIARWKIMYTCQSFMGCGVYPFGAECDILHSSGCYVTTYEKNESGDYNEVSDHYMSNRNLTCHNATYEDCKNNEIFSGFTSYYELESVKTSNITIRGCYLYSSDSNDCLYNLNLSEPGQRLTSEYTLNAYYDPCIPPIGRQWNITSDMVCDGYSVSIHSDTVVESGVRLDYSDSYFNQLSSSWRWISYGIRNFDNVTQSY